jgi:hypothetical protein
MVSLLLLPKWLVANRNLLLEADDLPVMIYHCELLHEEVRTLKASAYTHYLKQKLHSIHLRFSNKQT